jgi:N6-L-threonylcarbamoyladenine synthase
LEFSEILFARKFFGFHTYLYKNNTTNLVFCNKLFLGYSNFMIILGIETSCDETALCVLEYKNNKPNVLANIVHSQMDLHKEFGGVFPALAKREHIKNLPLLYEKVLKGSGLKETEITHIAVTEGPGLEPALWTGIVFAKELAAKLQIPIIPVNHMEGHIVSTFLENPIPEFPSLALLISGGHTELVQVDQLGEYKILGRTRDDAVGEAFDKVARLLNLPYPGGPEISKLAAQAKEENIPRSITLPRPMIHSKDFDFSFSGIKTHVLYTLQKIENISEDIKKDSAREFEEAVTEVLISKTRKALEAAEFKTLIIGGGVIANTYIREAFTKLAEEFDIPLYLPAPGTTGDNALMIAYAAALLPKTKDPSSISARGNLLLENSRELN